MPGFQAIERCDDAPPAPAGPGAAMAPGGPRREDRRTPRRRPFIGPAPGPGTAVDRLAVLVLVEPRRDQFGQRLDGLRGVGPACLQLEAGAALGGHHRQLQQTLAIKLVVIVADPDLGLEPRRQLDELHGGPDMQAEAVGDLDLAMGDRRLVAHRQLDRPGPGTGGRRLGSSARPEIFGIAAPAGGPGLAAGRGRVSSTRPAPAGPGRGRRRWLRPPPGRLPPGHRSHSLASAPAAGN